MDQIKIGKFISSKRKEKSLTQCELAEKLNITDRAVSKWENGICLPDASIMVELCKILGITINDLFSGEVVDMKNSKKKLEENLLALVRKKEEADRRMLNLEIVIGYMASITFFILIFVASFAPLTTFVRILLILFGFIIFIIGVIYAVKIEQIAGYYECANCHYKYIPRYKSVFFAMHVNRTRYMKCPKCKKRSWQKKVISK